MGSGKDRLCEIMHTASDMLLGAHGHLLNFNPAYFGNRLPVYAQAIGALCCMDDCIGFVDGTLRFTCRPGPHWSKLPPGLSQYNLQRSAYSGHKRHHGIKFQACTFPDGIMCLDGPYEGRGNDRYMWTASGWVAAFPLLVDAAGNLYSLFADGGYTMQNQLITPWPRALAPVGSPQRAFNDQMSRVRVSVEWGFNLITNSWQNLDFSRWQRIGLTNPGSQYRAAVLLHNIRACVRETNQVAVYFDLRPPTLQDYLSGNW
jgi:hypothetical protein